MNADQPSPAAPTSVPTALSPAGPSLPVIPHPDHPPKDDQSPVLLWLQSTWDKLKAGQVGDPKWIALVVGLILVAGGWWFFARSSKKADSALWYQFDTSLSKEDLKTFTDECEAMAGARLASIASKKVLSETCEISTIMPSRFISRTTSRP